MWGTKTSFGLVEWFWVSIIKLCLKIIHLEYVIISKANIMLWFDYKATW